MKRYILAFLLLILLAMPCYAQMAGKMKGGWSKGDAVNLNVIRPDEASGSGTDDSVSFPNDATKNQFSGSTSFTVEAWYKYSASGRIYDKRNAATGVSIATLSGTAWAMYFDFNNTNPYYESAHVSGQWTHAVIVWTGSQCIAYSNNVASSPIATGTGVPVNEIALSAYIGNRANGDRTFNGDIKVVRIYRNKGLSATEVAIAYKAGRFASKPISGCTQEIIFNEGSGAVRDDKGLAGTMTHISWGKDTLSNGGL